MRSLRLLPNIAAAKPRRSRRFVGCLYWLGCLAVAPLAAADEQVVDVPELLAERCYNCHGYGVNAAEFALDELVDTSDYEAQRAAWLKVWSMVRHEFMPPVGEEGLTSDERRAITRWIERQAWGVDAERPDPGRVTIRRLNRMEYEYTLVDLFGVELKFAGEFSSDSAMAESRLRDLLPPDDTAHGFDNIGDFQTLSPALLEKYFELAELIVGQLIVEEGPWYPHEELDGARLAVAREDDAPRVAHTAQFEIRKPGRYRVEVQFVTGGWQEFGGSYQFTLNVGDREPTEAVIDVGGQKVHRFGQEHELAAGPHTLAFTTTAVQPDSEGELKPLTLRPKIRITGPIDPTVRLYPESHRRIFFAGEASDDPAERREYASAILRRVADRAYRRPVDEATLARLTDLAMQDALEGEPNFVRGVGTALVAILTSPQFLFRAEMQPQPNDPQAIHPLDEYALASRLSYLLWLSLPDAELTQLAAEGRLRENLTSQVDRMLADPKSHRFFEDFAGQWLRTRNVLMTPISRQEEEIRPIRPLLKQETELLFEHIAREDRDLLELITADYTFLNDQLARYYGMPRVGGRTFRRVELPSESRRGGILTHGSFLVSTSNPDRTSPVKRGVFVLENLLATPPPAPPAAVPSLEDAQVDGRRPSTTREQLEVHRADPACASCHAHFDPIGVVLENFDLMGRWRDEEIRMGWRVEESRAPIDPTATTVTGAELAGIDDLRAYVAGRNELFYRCVTEKLMTYALGRGLEPYDAITVDQITDRLLSDGGRFSTLLLAVVESPAFQHRRGDDGELRLAPREAIPEIPPPDQRRPQRRRFFAQAFDEDGNPIERRRGRRGDREVVADSPSAEDAPSNEPSQ